jgi:hypothetical protein
MRQAGNPQSNQKPLLQDKAIRPLQVIQQGFVNPSYLGLRRSAYAVWRLTGVVDENGHGVCDSVIDLSSSLNRESGAPL